jgi:TonB-dependent receptor
MQMFKRFFLSSAVAATIVLPVQSLYAQTDDDPELETVVVTGIRASLEQGLDIKRDSLNVVDAIVSEDIGKFPDNNVVEALQRVTGVQVTDRGGGEVSVVTIRGQDDVSTTINGRNIFTTIGRRVELQDVPAALLSRVDVYKTRSADLIESGIAGNIDIKTQRPFNFDDSKFVFAARGINQEQVDSWDPSFSVMYSNRWDTGVGEFGALINFSQTDTSYRDQALTAGAQVPFVTETPNATGPYIPLERIFPGDGRVAEAPRIWLPGLEFGLDSTPGSTIDINGDPQEYYLARDAVFWNDFTGERERPAYNISLQWAPNDTSEYLFEAFYNGYRDDQFNSLMFTFVDWWGSLDLNDPLEVYPGTNVIKSRSINFPYGFNSGDYTKLKTDSYLYALGGKWQIGDGLELRSELVFQDSEYERNFFAQRIERVPERLFVDFNAGDGIPALEFQDLAGNNTNALATDVAQWNMAPLYANGNEDEGDALTLTFDGDYAADWGFINTFKFGLRYDDRTAKSGSYGTDGLAGCGGCVITDFPGLTGLTTGFYDGRANIPTAWVIPTPSGLQANHDALVTAYGMDTRLLINQPDYEMGEVNTALYLMAEFAQGNLDGQFGVRYVDIDRDMNFFAYAPAPGLGKADPASQTTQTKTISDSKALPSFVLRYHFADDLIARLAYGKTLRYPDFNQGSETVVYTPDVTNIGYGTAIVGNSQLLPTESTNIDLTLEWYFGDASALYLTYFDRDIEGIIVPFYTQIIYDVPNDNPDRGPYPFILESPGNASDGELSGFELGAVWFPENLPGLLDGFGVQASYTILDSKQVVPIVDTFGNIGETEQPIFNVSDDSYSIVLAYDRTAFDVRLSYVWRESFVSRYEAALFANPRRISRKPETSLDFQVTWDVTDFLALTLDATNLTDEIQQEYYDDTRIGNSSTIHNFGNVILSRTYALGARFSF